MLGWYGVLWKSRAGIISPARGRHVRGVKVASRMRPWGHEGCARSAEEEETHPPMKLLASTDTKVSFGGKHGLCPWRQAVRFGWSVSGTR